MRTFLVTGAAGFIGSHLCDRLLADGKRVIGVDDLSRGSTANLLAAKTHGGRFIFYPIDIRAERLQAILDRHRPEVVMHLAAQSSVRASVADSVLDASINVVGLLNLLEGATRAGVRKVVFASSGGTIYGNQRQFPIKESARTGACALSPYGISKKVAEDYLTFFRRQRNLEYTVLALGNVYGPRQEPSGEAGVVAIFATKMILGQCPTIFGDGTQTRDYVFVDDAVHAFSLAAEAGSGLLLNIGTGVETSVNAIWRLLATTAGFTGHPVRGPLPPGEPWRVVLDNQLAATELRWQPRMGLEDGLKKTWAWLRDSLRDREPRSPLTASP
jgi:UDP-glucose 4-epimerase